MLNEASQLNIDSDPRYRRLICGEFLLLSINQKFKTLRVPQTEMLADRQNQTRRLPS